MQIQLEKILKKNFDVIGLLKYYFGAFTLKQTATFVSSLQVFSCSFLQLDEVDSG